MLPLILKNRTAPTPQSESLLPLCCVLLFQSSCSLNYVCVVSLPFFKDLFLLERQVYRRLQQPEVHPFKARSSFFHVGTEVQGLGPASSAFQCHWMRSGVPGAWTGTNMGCLYCRLRLNALLHWLKAFSFLRFIYLKSNVIGEREDFHPLVHALNRHNRWGKIVQAKARSLKLDPRTPRGWQGACIWAVFLCFPRCVSSELD